LGVSLYLFGCGVRIHFVTTALALRLLREQSQNLPNRGFKPAVLKAFSLIKVHNEDIYPVLQ